MIKKKRIWAYLLAIASILGFTGIVIESFTTFDFAPWFSSLLLIIFGIALMYEGRIVDAIKYAKNGLTNEEVIHIFASLFGLLAVISGILSLPPIGVTSLTFVVLKGVIAVFAIPLIILEAFFVK